MGQRGEHAQLEEGPRSAGEKIFVFFIKVLRNAGNNGLVFSKGLLETWRLEMLFQDDQNNVAIFPLKAADGLLTRFCCLFKK